MIAKTIACLMNSHHGFFSTAQLQSIDLSRQPISINQAAPLSDILILDFGLKYLDVSNTKLDDEVLVTIYIYIYVCIKAKSWLYSYLHFFTCRQSVSYYVVC